VTSLPSSCYMVRTGMLVLVVSLKVQIAHFGLILGLLDGNQYFYP